MEDLNLPAVYLDLELDDDIRKLEQAETYLRYHDDKLVIIDEIQRMPRLFPLLRALTDENRRPGRFLILGSASPGVLRESSESLAGRIAYTELTPLSLPEVTSHTDMLTHWVRGGFPEPLLAKDEVFVWRWLDNFLNTFLERDLRALGYEISPLAMRRTLQMLTSFHGNLLHISEISRSLGINAPTISRYLDILEGSYLIFRFPPYFANVSKRLVKASKFYFRDSGLFHSLSGIRSADQLFDNRFIGASWEGYVVEQIRRASGEFFEFFFYRTHAGAEADLIIKTPKNELIAVEIKLSMAPGISKGFHLSAADLGAKAKYIIVYEGESYPRGDGVWVCNLGDFLEGHLGGL